MTQQDDITQRVLTDADIEALAKKHIAPHADCLDAIIANPVPYQKTEQFRRVKALIADVLSQVRAPVADERAAHGYGSPADVSQRIEQYLAQDGRMNSGTQLLYEAMKALRSLAKESK